MKAGQPAGCAFVIISRTNPKTRYPYARMDRNLEVDPWFQVAVASVLGRMINPPRYVPAALTVKAPTCYTNIDGFDTERPVV